MNLISTTPSLILESLFAVSIEIGISLLVSKSNLSINTDFVI
jgi:hypothetical protein